jgi:ribosomal protein S18 acetylase RimI-like enzyme
MKKLFSYLSIITLAKLLWAPFKTISRAMSTHEQLRVSVPSLLTSYRKTPFSFEDGMSEWKGEGGLLFATKDENLIGLLRLDKHRTYVELSSFIVNPAYQGSGYGGKMLDTVIKHSELPIWLRVHRDNPAYALYSRHGFQRKELVNNRYLMKI